jgi:hypothetical protein
MFMTLLLEWLCPPLKHAYMLERLNSGAAEYAGTPCG